MADEDPWFGLSEAAQRSGLAREAIRARARRGQITSRKGNRGELLVQLPAELLTGSGQVSPGHRPTLWPTFWPRWPKAAGTELACNQPTQRNRRTLLGSPSPILATVPMEDRGQATICQEQHQTTGETQWLPFL